MVIALAILVLVMVPLTFVLARHTAYADQALPLVLVGGITIFLISLSLVVLVFKRLELTDPRYALGLPDGSIRAFIALSLILLFFIMVTFFFFDSPSPARTDRISDLTPEQFRAIPADQLNFAVAQPNGNYTIVRNLPPVQTSQDLAKQVTTTVSTLVVAIASFYFGSTSVASATAGQGRGDSNTAPASPAAAPPAPAAPGDAAAAQAAAAATEAASSSAGALPGPSAPASGETHDRP